jgi:uncharacterized protein (DUF1501 family)
MLSRRFFLRNSALAMFGVGSAPGWLARAVYGQNLPATRKRILIAIFQRGAVDGLNMVVPHGDPAYYAARPSIAIPKPGISEGSALDLDGYFGLHPSLAGLKPLWDKKQLAIVEACGSPDATRSHFDAQDYMESGTPGVKATPDGWLNRALPSEVPSSPIRAVSMTADLPRCLRGNRPALAIENLNTFKIADDRMTGAFETMYRNAADPVLSNTGRETFEAVRMMQAVEGQTYTPANGAAYPAGRLGQSLKQIARLIKADVGLEVAFTDVGGWDTHVNEVGDQPHLGHLANLLRNFGDSLAAFSQDMGDRMEDITLVTMSEFGRTVRENGDRGTDHGHANVMFVLGGTVKGGRIAGNWPGLAPEQLYEGRDLVVTTDFRDVLSELITRQMQNHNLAAVFPGHRSTSVLGLLSV